MNVITFRQQEFAARVSGRRKRCQATLFGVK